MIEKLKDLMYPEAMIYITGDTHIPIDIGKLAEDRFAEQFFMSKEDYLIICGDFGGVWSESLMELKWRDWLDHRSFTTLFVDGNHENFDLLNSYPLEQWNGGQVHRIGQSIYHLMRGQVFTLQGQKFITMGGGLSIDRANRTPGLSWWPQEMPSAQEYDEAWANLEHHGFSVDYVITHAVPETFMRKLFPVFRHPGEEELTEFLDKVHAYASYRHWYFGHLHEDRQMDDRHTALYDNIVKLPLGEDGQDDADISTT